MKKLLLASTVFFGLTVAHGQTKITLKQLQGNWTACNKDSLYYKSDTIHFYSSTDVQNCCNNIYWFIAKKSTAINYGNCLTKDYSYNATTTKSKNIKIGKIDNKQFIETYTYNSQTKEYETNRFEFISLKTEKYPTRTDNATYIKLTLVRQRGRK